MAEGVEQFRTTIVFFIVLSLCVCGYAEIYKSIMWTPNNPIFMNKTCPDGDIPEMRVLVQSTLPIICPQINVVMSTLSQPQDKSKLNENIWILFDQESFDACDVNLTARVKTDWKNAILKNCSAPLTREDYTIKFLTSTATDDAIEFEQGRYYFFMATSDGTVGSLGNTEGGHCDDKITGIRLKFKVYLCNTNDFMCPPEHIGELKCSSNFAPLTTAPPTTSNGTLPTNGSVPTTGSSTSNMSSCSTPEPNDPSLGGRTGGSTSTKDELKKWKIAAIALSIAWFLTLLLLLYSCYKYKLNKHLCFTDLNKVCISGKNSTVPSPTKERPNPLEPQDKSRLTGYSNPSFDDCPDGKPGTKPLANGTKGDSCSPDEGVTSGGSLQPSKTPSSENTKTGPNNSTNGSQQSKGLTDDEKVENMRNSERRTAPESGDKNQSKAKKQKKKLLKLKTAPKDVGSNPVVFTNRGVTDEGGQINAGLEGSPESTPEQLV